MYKYIDKTDIFHWFTASDNAIYEIALLYQRNLISRDCIKTSPGMFNMLVGLVNNNEYKFFRNENYHLYLKPTNGIINIELLFLEDDFIASWFRPDLQELVNESTWKALFGNDVNINKIPMLTDYEYQCDYLVDEYNGTVSSDDDLDNKSTIYDKLEYDADEIEYDLDCELEYLTNANPSMPIEPLEYDEYDY
jgi:hypothetical protein